MALQIGVNAFSEAADVSRLTGTAYDAQSRPPFAQVEQAIEDAFGIVSARLSVAGYGSPPYQAPNLLRLVRPLSSRFAAIGDVQRLKQLHQAAIQVPSLEAFRRLLDAGE